MNFKDKVKKHQLHFFENYNQNNILNKKGRAQNHWLKEEYAGDGKIFYSDYDIFKFVKEKRDQLKKCPEWFMDTLRSQHIPFNLFIPFCEKRKLCKSVFNQLLNINISEIIDIKIEYPSSKENPLKDKTSFDVFILYKSNNKTGFLGIEVKYTEGGYSPTKKEKEHYPFYRNYTKKVALYNDFNDDNLIKNSYRQIWRNHLLACAFAKENKYDEYFSLTLYPQGNVHFVKALTNFNTFLNDKGKNTLKGITYENFITTLINSPSTEKQYNWIKYLIERYIISEKEVLLNKLKKAVK